MNKYGILFVCTGNICRSPTAEGVLRHYILQEGLQDRFVVDSAGTHGYHVGEAPDPRSVAAALARGIRMDDLRARRIARQDFDDFDLVLAMDRGHYDILEGMKPEKGRAKLAMFLDYHPAAGGADVPDPYYGGMQDFEHVLDLAEQGARDLLEALKREWKL